VRVAGNKRDAGQSAGGEVAEEGQTPGAVLSGTPSTCSSRCLAITLTSQ